MKSDVMLFPEFSVDCYDGENEDDGRCRYKIAIAVQGVAFEKVRMGIFHPLVEGSVLHDLDRDQFTVDADRPIVHPPTMSSDDARTVLNAVFRKLDLCRGYEDGFIISIPIDLHDWAREYLPLAVADTAEKALLAAVMLNNSVFN